MIKFGRRTGVYPEFSNFYECTVKYNNGVYGSSEAAWQAQKTLDLNIRKRFENYTPSGAKKMGRRVNLRSDWEDVKYQLMVDVCYAKFSQNEDLKEKLLSTGSEEIIENTTGWHDNIWGDCECSRCVSKEGKNLLGKALMEVRSTLKAEQNSVM